MYGQTYEMFPVSILSLVKRCLAAALLNVENKNKVKVNYSHNREKICDSSMGWSGIRQGSLMMVEIDLSN